MKDLKKQHFIVNYTEKVLLSIFLFLVIVANSIEAKPAAPAVNIMDYANTVVDGDYTKAIRMAIAAAAETRSYEIYFPAGHYSISDTIDMNSATPISGGKVTIQQRDSEKDIFYADQVWQRTIRGFSFLGGHDQIAIGNKNVDQGFIVISECKFKDASGAAIRFIRKGKSETASTYCLVEKCHFSRCIQSLISVSDLTTFRDCWITTSAKNIENMAVIENYGVLKCINILGVPLVTSTDQRWIDNHGSVICNNFRFGGEGAGFTPVVNYKGMYKEGYGSFVILEDSFLAALGNNKRACAVYCEEIPNMIVVHNCNLYGVPAIKIRETLDLNTCFTGVRPGMMRYSISGNIGELAGTLPEEMIAAASSRTAASYNYGDKQLSGEMTRKRMNEIKKEAVKFKSDPEPLIVTYQIPKGEKGHTQQLNGYIDVNPNTYEWSLDDYLDATTELNSDYLAIDTIVDDVIILNRIDDGKYPDIRIKNVNVDLSKTPYLTWKLKNVGTKGGHIAVKVIDKATDEQVLLMENYCGDQTDYLAYDLRKFFKNKDKISIDIKLYLCGVRITGSSGKNMSINLKKGDWMLLDFMRLEPDK